MTDRRGVVQRSSVPPGSVQDTAWRDQLERGHELMPPEFQEVLDATEQPFIQPIQDLASDRMIRDRVACAAKSALDAMTLADALSNPSNRAGALEQSGSETR